MYNIITSKSLICIESVCSSPVVKLCAQIQIKPIRDPVNLLLKQAHNSSWNSALTLWHYATRQFWAVIHPNSQCLVQYEMLMSECDIILCDPSTVLLYNCPQCSPCLMHVSMKNTHTHLPKKLDMSSTYIFQTHYMLYHTNTTHTHTLTEKDRRTCAYSLLPKVVDVCTHIHIHFAHRCQKAYVITPPIMSCSKLNKSLTSADSKQRRDQIDHN